MITLAEALPDRIKAVRHLQDEFRQLLGMPGVIVEPQIGMMERDIEAGLDAIASGDVVAMLHAWRALDGWGE